MDLFFLQQIIAGGNNLASGAMSKNISNMPTIISSLQQKGFRHKKQASGKQVGKPNHVSRYHYAHIFGPTTGDRVRLGINPQIIRNELIILIR